MRTSEEIEKLTAESMILISEIEHTFKIHKELHGKDIIEYDIINDVMNNVKFTNVNKSWVECIVKYLIDN